MRGGLRRLAIRVTGDLGFRFDTPRPGWPHSDGVMDGAGEARNRSYRRFESHPAFYDTSGTDWYRPWYRLFGAAAELRRDP